MCRISCTVQQAFSSRRLHVGLGFRVSSCMRFGVRYCATCGRQGLYWPVVPVQVSESTGLAPVRTCVPMWAEARRQSHHERGGG